MNKFIESLLLFVLGFGIGAGIIIARQAPITVSVSQNSVYCSEPPALIPFFDPCPKDSHVDKIRAIKCGAEYQATIARIMSNACLDNKSNKEELSKRVADDVQKALDDYFTLLLACPCLENGVVK